LFDSVNTKEYIESGVLELYVSGLLSIEEMRDVELKACQYPEVKTELQLNQSAFERFAMSHAMQPRSELKDRILAAIQNAEASPGKVDTGEQRETIIRQLPSSKSNYSRLMAAASIALLAISSAIAFYFSSQYSKAKEELAIIQEQQVTLQRQMEQSQLAMNDNASKLRLLTDANTVRVTMKGTAVSPESIALIYWNRETQSVYLDIKSLHPLLPISNTSFGLSTLRKTPLAPAYSILKLVSS
jgi:anti-sigma-K factor RskA